MEWSLSDDWHVLADCAVDCHGEDAEERVEGVKGGHV